MKIQTLKMYVCYFIRNVNKQKHSSVIRFPCYLVTALFIITQLAHNHVFYVLSMISSLYILDLKIPRFPREWITTSHQFALVMRNSRAQIERNSFLFSKRSIISKLVFKVMNPLIVTAKAEASCNLNVKKRNKLRYMINIASLRPDSFRFQSSF